MRLSIIPIIISAMLVCQANLHARTDTLDRIVGNGEAINLNLLWYSINYGDISWEYSSNGNDWVAISNENTKNYRFEASADRLYRARVNSGTCDPFYSRITRLMVADIFIDSVFGVGVSEASVAASFPENGITFTESGIRWSKDPLFVTGVNEIINNSGEKQFRADLTGLETGATFYTRPFIRLTDGTIVSGKAQSFSTLEIKRLPLANTGTTTASLFYIFSATPDPSEHGICYGTEPDPDLSSGKAAGIADGEEYRADLQNLNPGSLYYAKPYMIINGVTLFGEAFTFRTYTNYSSYPVETVTPAVSHRIVWNNPSTARKISAAGTFADYGRIRRVGNSDTLLLTYHGGPSNGDWTNIYLRKSTDNGTTWQPQQTIRNISDYNSSYWRFCNPELLVMKNGWVMLAFEANAKPDENKSEVHILISKDTCRTWEEPVKYLTGRSWEPAMVELPEGEIELFYSSEARWWPVEPIYQEIMVIRSTDQGASWSKPKTVAYYPAKRDGMPVPVLLPGNRGIAFAIETVNSAVSPYIIKRDLASDWVLTTSNFDNNTYRWLVSGFSGHGGAPYLLRLPSGELALSAHIYRGGDWHQNNYMQVMVGDSNAKNFSRLSSPWPDLPSNESAVNNSLFLKNQNTVVAVSCRMFTDGSGGIYWLEGTITPD
ncbi:MAG: sialidase family protein [Bacteroidota bacterium]